MYPRINLRPERRKQFQGHKHPWIFSGAIKNIEPGHPESLDGQIVSVFIDGQFLLHGYYNSQSQIAIRALSWQEKEQLNQDFLESKIEQSLLLRKKFVLTPETTACRLIFAESDFLPGFVVDKYNDTLIVQIHTLGAEKLKKDFVQALAVVYKEIFGTNPGSIMEKSDLPARQHEGLSPFHQETLQGKEVEQETILENGHRFLVDFRQGQKTGFFLDQRENRQALTKYVNGKRILNLFSYTGGFSVYAGTAGATEVDSVDISEPATAIAESNMELNKVPCPHSEIAADCFKYLENIVPESLDVIIVDPPAFIKSRNNFNDGLKGYISINALALNSLADNGILVTSSCSAALNDDDFLRMLNWAAESSNCQLQIIEKKAQPADHPLTPYFPEGNYLKFVIARKVKI
jgi:23S rRNA (cytosine1962-C5)-methyltransferase